MSYEPTNWKTGDVVTSAKLNKLENGVANGGCFLKVTSRYNPLTKASTMDKTWQEIYDVFANGGYVSHMSLDPEVPLALQRPILLVDYSDDDNRYRVVVSMGGSDNIYFCNTADDYPALENDSPK